MEGFWQPIASAVPVLLGFLVKVLTDHFQNKHSLGRERENRAALRKEKLLDRRAELQRTTLLELQEVLAKLVRAGAKIHYIDELSEAESGAWKKQLLPDGDSEAFRALQERAILLSARILDVKLKEVVDDLRGVVASLVFASSATSASLYYEKMSRLYPETQDEIGRILRDLDEVEKNSF